MLTLSSDDETDLAQMEANVRAIEWDGLKWGASQLVPVGFGIKKLTINLVVEDEKVSTSDLQEKIEEDEDFVQSTDIVRPTPSNLFTTRANYHPGCYAKDVSACLEL